MFAGRAVCIMIHACRLCLVGTGSTVLCVGHNLWLNIQFQFLFQLRWGQNQVSTLTNITLKYWSINQETRGLFSIRGGGPRVVVSTAAFHARFPGSVPGLGGLKETKMFLPHPRVKVSIVGSLRDGEVACSASDRQGSNFESCVWRTVSSQSSHHLQEVLLAQFSLYVHKGGLKPDSFYFIFSIRNHHKCAS